MQIVVAAQDGCFGSAVASVIDILQVADAIRGDVDPSIPPVELAVAASRREVATTTRMQLRADRSLAELADADVVIVPALGTLTAVDTDEALTNRAGRDLVGAIEALDADRVRIAGACTGVFAIASAGQLDGRRATTTWYLGPAFRRSFPAVELDLDHMVVVDGPTVTAGAAFAHIDLTLGLVRSISPELAAEVARLLLIDERASQAAFVAFDHLEHDDPVVVAFERHVREHLDQPFDAAAAAAAVGVGRRSLERRLRAALNLTPLGFVQRLRLERARHLRTTTALSTEDIAQRVGYANAETLRALLRRSDRAR